jgi:hypothetical protein
MMGRLIGQAQVAFYPWRPVKRRSISAEHHSAAEASLKDSIYPTVTNISICRFLMDESRRVAEAKLASLRTLEGKAIAQVGVSGTILAILTAFGRDIPLPWRAIPLALLVVAILCYLRAGYVRTGALPSLGGYLNDTVVADPENEARIALQLAGSWTEYGLEVEQDNKFKAQFVRAGAIWLQVALFSLLAVVIVTGYRKQETTLPSVNTATSDSRSGVHDGGKTQAGRTREAGTKRR